VHGTTSVEQGAPGGNSRRKVNQVNASTIVKGLLFGFEGPSLRRFFDTLDAEKRVRKQPLPLCAASLSGPIAQLARARA
jgi:hypothetical protein